MSLEKKPSKRFRPTGWSEKLIPLLLILLSVFLIGTMLLLLLSLAGVLPSA